MDGPIFDFFQISLPGWGLKDRVPSTDPWEPCLPPELSKD